MPQGDIKDSIRAKLVEVLRRTPRPMTGHELAKAIGIPYKPTVDALNALRCAGRVQRIGCKYSAKWSFMPENQAPLIDTILVLWSRR